MLTKVQIISWVKELGDKIGKDTLSVLFQDDKTQGEKRIGHGQFRELAALCTSAECYEEIELLVKYNTAKAKRGESWAIMCGNQKFGDLVVSYMNTVKAAEKNANDLLTDLMHFFGYLYWQSRVWSAENPAPQRNANRPGGYPQSGGGRPNPQQGGRPNPQFRGGNR